MSKAAMDLWNSLCRQKAKLSYGLPLTAQSSKIWMATGTPTPQIQLREILLKMQAKFFKFGTYLH